jgi:signal transduction protein with GAF and PtsI domain
MSLETELQAACAATRGLFGAAACSCALAVEDGGELEFVAADGAGAENIVGVRLPISRGIAGFVALSGQAIAIADLASDERFARDIAEATEYVPSSILAAPLLDQDGETMGVLEVLDPAHPDDDSRMGAQRGTVAELAALTVVAASMASVVRLSKLLAATIDVPADAELLAALAELTAGDPQGARLAREVLVALASYARGRR